MQTLQAGRPAEAEHPITLIDNVPEQDDGIAFVFEILSCDVLGLFNLPNHGNSGGGINWAARILIVEADISTSYRRIEYTTGLSQSFNGAPQLIEDFRIVGIAEIQ